MKRQFVQLAHKYEPKKHFIANWFMSVKLDGIRAIWDGGISRKLLCDEVPWANVEKAHRLRERPISTGLWTRLGHPIYAPDWFLDGLPPYLLDGELWCPTGSWQTLSSVVKKFNPDDEEWKRVEYRVLDSPWPEQIFADGVINITNFKKTLAGISEWIKNKKLKVFTGEKTFQFVYEKLKLNIINTNIIKLHEQVELPFKNYDEVINVKLNEVVDSGGEGLILKMPWSIWAPERSNNVLKYKPFHDDEAIVTGFIFGRRTDLGSKLLGKMGSMITDYKGKRLELSGFTDEERILIGFNVQQLGEKLAGKEVPLKITNPRFPRGSIVTIRYRELSDTGIPKEARFLRKYIS